MTISLVSDTRVKSCVTDKHNTKYNTFISEQPYIQCPHCPVVNFQISGTKWASPGTRDTVGQFWDDLGHSGMVGKPMCLAHGNPCAVSRAIQHRNPWVRKQLIPYNHLSGSHTSCQIFHQ